MPEFGQRMVHERPAHGGTMRSYQPHAAYLVTITNNCYKALCCYAVTKRYAVMLFRTAVPDLIHYRARGFGRHTSGFGAGTAGAAGHSRPRCNRPGALTIEKKTALTAMPL